MKLLFYVLSQTDKLDDFLTALGNRNLCGATVLDATGMARYLNSRHDNDEIQFLSSLREFLNPDRVKSNIVLMIVQKEQVQQVVEVIEEVIAPLNTPDSGIVFTVPLDFVKGVSCFAE
ncbi:hypothetical protein Q5O14_06365 [Eubacteriaceae bacterium ES2]|nr:hypothetical protein Q5O14_06365 [Eubacteriaceae bacterium ES2]